MKILSQFLLLVALFLGLYCGLSQVNWVAVLKIEQHTRKTEQQLGDLLWESVSSSEQVIQERRIQQPLDSLVHLLCRANGIGRTIKVHVLQSEEVNAFALPGNHLVVLSGLIDACDNEAELLGVLGHEIAHMEQKHVMKKLAKEIGLSVLLSAGTGGNNPVVLRKAVQTLSSSAYDRKLEAEADKTSVAYLLKAGADPEGLAFFLDKIALLQSEKGSQYPEWLDTHPDSAKRAAQIRQSLAGKTYSKNNLTAPLYWEALKTAVAGLSRTTTAY